MARYAMGIENKIVSGEKLSPVRRRLTAGDDQTRRDIVPETMGSPPAITGIPRIVQAGKTETLGAWSDQVIPVTSDTEQHS
jgi:hypothetical protein